MITLSPVQLLALAAGLIVAGSYLGSAVTMAHTAGLLRLPRLPRPRRSRSLRVPVVQPLREVPHA